MSGSTARLQAIDAVKGYQPPAGVFEKAEAPGEVFGQNVFTKSVMQSRLPKPVFKSLMSTIENAKPLDPAVADVVATAMKDWAMEKGATHYAHVFYPLTGLTAEKHDSFLEPGTDGASIAEFAGNPDSASSRVNPMHRASPTAGCGRRSKRVATRDGTPRAPRTSSRTRTGTRCASRRCSSR